MKLFTHWNYWYIIITMMLAQGVAISVLVELRVYLGKQRISDLDIPWLKLGRRVQELGYLSKNQTLRIVTVLECAVLAVMFELESLDGATAVFDWLSGPKGGTALELLMAIVALPVVAALFYPLSNLWLYVSQFLTIIVMVVVNWTIAALAMIGNSVIMAADRLYRQVLDLKLEAQEAAEKRQRMKLVRRELQRSNKITEFPGRSAIDTAMATSRFLEPGEDADYIMNETEPDAVKGLEEIEIEHLSEEGEVVSI